MTQRNQADENNAEIYDASDTPRRAPQSSTSRSTRTRTVDQRPMDVDVITPVDRIRWGAVLAGLFAALATLAALTVLGIAIGGSLFNPGESASSFGFGAGIYGALSALIAFFVGGWMAGRTAALPGRSSGVLNGAMVWFVAIPLLIYLLGSGVGALVGTAGRVAGTAAQTLAPAAGQAADQAANNPQLQATAQAQVGDAAGAIQATAQAVQSAAQDPQNQQVAADAISTGAWGTLLSLGVAALAAIVGGIVGARRPEDDLQLGNAQV